MRHNEVSARAVCNARCYMYRSAPESAQGVLNSVSHATPCTKAPADTRLSMAVHCERDQPSALRHRQRVQKRGHQI